MENSISNRIRLFRTALGYSQEYVAKKLHITQQAYSIIENTPEKATLERLKKLAELLKVDLFTLIGEDKSLIQTNINQKGGNAATQMIFHPEKNIAFLYEKHTHDLQNQIEFLKKMLINSKVK